MHRVLQSYELHIVSEHLSDRYPYLEQEFKDREDPSEVYHSVFDREIPKLVEILSMKQIDKHKYRDALITLTEMVSHQENKDKQITADLVAISSDFLLDELPEIQREAVLLLGSLVSVMKGREAMTQNSSAGLAQLLFHNLVLNREACGWCLVRIASARDGVEFIAKKELARTMIESFLKYSENIQIEDTRFLIYLLEAFANILQYDNGIIYFLGSGMVPRLHKILQRINRNQQDEARINYLCLDCLAKISVNMKGKQECIDEKVIATANLYLDSDSFLEVNYATNLIMSCAIHLDGKKQCVYVENNLIIKRLIAQLDSKNEELRKNIKQTLTNIADLPDGFLIITKELVRSINYLEEIFGAKAIMTLAAHLPRTRDLQCPPLLPENNINFLKSAVQGICFFIKNYNDAVTICVEQTVKLVEKLLPFMQFKTEREQIANAIVKICAEDEYSRDLVRKYVEQYGNTTQPQSNQSLTAEIQKFPALNEIVQGSQD